MHVRKCWRCCERKASEQACFAWHDSLPVQCDAPRVPPCAVSTAAGRPSPARAGRPDPARPPDWARPASACTKGSVNLPASGCLYNSPLPLHLLHRFSQIPCSTAPCSPPLAFQCVPTPPPQFCPALPTNRISSAFPVCVRTPLVSILVSPRLSPCTLVHRLSASLPFDQPNDHLQEPSPVMPHSQSAGTVKYAVRLQKMLAQAAGGQARRHPLAHRCTLRPHR